AEHGRVGSRSPLCATTFTARNIRASLRPGPSGSKRWTSRTIVYGGFPQATFPRSEKAANALSITKSRDQHRIPFGSQSSIRSRKATQSPFDLLKFLLF